MYSQEQIREYVRYTTHKNGTRVNVDTQKGSTDSFPYRLLIDGEYSGEYKTLEDADQQAEALCRERTCNFCDGSGHVMSGSDPNQWVNDCPVCSGTGGYSHT